METNGHNNENGEQTKIYLRYTYLGNFVVARLQIRCRLVVDRCIVRTWCYSCDDRFRCFGL